MTLLDSEWRVTLCLIIYDIGSLTVGIFYYSNNIFYTGSLRFLKIFAPLNMTVLC